MVRHESERMRSTILAKEMPPYPERDGIGQATTTTHRLTYDV